MKKNCIVLLYCILCNFNYSFSQYVLPQLQTGVNVNNVFAYFSYPFTTNCLNSGFNDFHLEFASDVINLVPGVEIKCVIINLPPSPDSVYTIPGGRINIGDTLTFNQSHGYLFQFYSSGVGSVLMGFVAKGVPIVSGTFYPCSLYILSTSPTCGIYYLVQGDSFDSCFVDHLNWVDNPVEEKSYSISPNPVSEYFTLSTLQRGCQDCIFELFDLQGVEILKQKLKPNFHSERFLLPNIRNGIYIWRLSSKDGFFERGKLIVNR